MLCRRSCSAVRRPMRRIDALFDGRGVQLVAHSVDSADHVFAGKITGNFLAQVLDVGIDGSFVTFKIISLNDINQLVAGKNAIGMTQEGFQEIILTGS